MKKKILAVLLTVVLLIGALALPASAYEDYGLTPIQDDDPTLVNVPLGSVRFAVPVWYMEVGADDINAPHYLWTCIEGSSDYDDLVARARAYGDYLSSMSGKKFEWRGFLTTEDWEYTIFETRYGTNSDVIQFFPKESLIDDLRGHMPDLKVLPQFDFYFEYGNPITKPVYEDHVFLRLFTVGWGNAFLGFELYPDTIYATGKYTYRFTCSARVCYNDDWFPGNSIVDNFCYSYWSLGGVDRYDLGYEDGRVDGYLSGHSDGYNKGYNDGYNTAWREIDAEGNFDFVSLIKGIFLAPAEFISSMLNFEVFGINLATAVKVIFTILLVVAIVLLIIKFIPL